ncbi:hypothetical protein AAFF_G00088890 [Aldrovandia affinis]|uniref:Reverse transcriptase domain-containing protein n=1 Tax=Aldrovandia affinis TaxID=143900 RepID=A0AAD7R3H1_9TELE|nr:hypothetical protein AAFF_G00088890 [Aldrovandia affinis]
MRAVLPDLIHPDQSCAVPGRRITDSLVLPLAQVLRRDAWISGLGIPGSGGMEARCILYMDDVTVCCTDATSVGRVLDRTEWFGWASGARLNRDKTTLKVYGRWTETDLRDLPLTVTADNVRILGVNFDSEGLRPDPVVEAALLDCVSARLESEGAQSMEADVSLEEEKAFDRVQHGFLHGVLKRMGFGPRFISWVRTLYAGVYSCVWVNGFLSGPVEQAGGVRQGCLLSPLLYVLFMEPFAELVRRDPGVDGVRLPGASGEVLKIQQYADDTTLFVSSARSLARIRALTDLFGAGTGSKVNLAKSSVLYCGRWRDDRSGAVLNWEARLNLVRTRLGVWTRRQLSLTGRVVVVRSVLLPLLIHLAYVFPVPARTKLALTRLVFRFLWGGGYEYVTREQMYMPVSGGGRGVPRIPLKLDVLHVCYASRIFLERVPHRCYYFARFYLAGFFRHLVALSHVVPRSESPSPGYGTVIRFLRQCPLPVMREEATDHRALYARLASRQVVTPSGVPAGVVWSRVSGGGAPGAVRDLQWRCALGRLREILHGTDALPAPCVPEGVGHRKGCFTSSGTVPTRGSSGPWSRASCGGSGLAMCCRWMGRLTAVAWGSCRQ